MMGGPMGVAVNHDRVVMCPECSCDRFRIDVHDRELFFLLRVFALLADRFDDGLALREGLLQKRRLPSRIADLITKPLVGDIIGAPTVAMTQEQALSVDDFDDRVGQADEASTRREALTEEKVAIARHEITGCSSIRKVGEGFRNGCGQRAFVVVARPVLEQVTQDVQGVRTRRLPGQELKEGAGGVRRLLAKM